MAQTISGYDAVGVRPRYAPPLAREFAASNYSDLSCSDDIGALIQQTHEWKSRNGRESKSESTMENIERREPDPSLLQIPSDYTVIRRAAEGNPPACCVPFLRLRILESGNRAALAVANNLR